ncbi:MAG: hypothetical protein QW640_00565 [Nitrososphaerota archaeon]
MTEYVSQTFRVRKRPAVFLPKGFSTGELVRVKVLQNGKVIIEPISLSKADLYEY